MIIWISLIVQVIAITSTVTVHSQDRGSVHPDSPSTNLVRFISLVRGKAKALENSTGMRLGFRSFLSAHNLAVDSISYSDFVVVRLLRYLREGVFLKSWTREQAAHTALRRRDNLVSGAPEDLAAFQSFAQDMRTDIR